jgi:acetyl esterase/lipase
MTDMAEQRIVLPASDETIEVKRDLKFEAEGGTNRSLDLYRRSGSVTEALPAVVFVSGYPDSGFEKVVGRKFKDMGAYQSWSQLSAGAGMAAVTYECEHPREDGAAVLRHLQANAANLGIDAQRIALWACSGNVPTALSLIVGNPAGIRCAALCYGYFLDLEEATAVADAAAQFGFARPIDSLSADMLNDTPSLLVRAGADEMPGLNETMDRFVQHSLAANSPLTLINYPEGVHAFDLWDASEPSQAVIRQILSYLKALLSPVA